MIEIEHKYLLKHAPIYIGVNPQTITQDYIEMGNEYYLRLTEMVKPKNSSHAFAIKSKRAALSRTEITVYIDYDNYCELLHLSDRSRVLLKRRYKRDSWDIDEFLFPKQLWVAEFEVTNESDPVTIPDWLEPYIDREVTGEEEYYNFNLALKEK